MKRNSSSKGFILYVLDKYVLDFLEPQQANGNGSSLNFIDNQQNSTQSSSHTGLSSQQTRENDPRSYS